MADAQIGSLLVLLEANTAKLDEQIKQSRQGLTDFKSAVDLARDALIGIGAAEFFKSIIDDTAEAEKAQALLASQIKATGDASGLTEQQLIAMAEGFQSTTVYSHQQIEGLESELMAFRNVAGEQFKGAIAAALDFSTVTGRDATQAVRTLGMALNDPATNMSKLARAGIDLNEATKNTIISLQGQGDLIGAQNLLLSEMEKSYGGAAAAARDTLGGALAGLKNDFHDLLEGNGSGVKDVTEGVKDLDAAISDPDVKAGIASLVSGLLELVGVAAKVAAAFAEAGKSLGEFFAKATGASGNFDDQISDLTVKIAHVKDEINMLHQGGQGKESPAVRVLERQLAEYEYHLKDVQLYQKALAGGGDSTTEPTTHAGLDGVDQVLTPKFDDTNIKQIDSGGAGQKSAYDQLLDDQKQVQAIWKQNDPSAYLQTEIDKTKELVGTVVNGQIFTTDDAAKHIQDLNQKFDESMNQMTEFSKEAARNIQDELGAELFDGFHDGLRGMAEDFAKTLEKMVDQLIASGILNMAFGQNDPNNKGSGQAGLASFISSGISSGIGHLFGGSGTPVGAGHAAGGDVSAGTLYPVNEEGPELYTDSGGNDYLMPSSNGHITPNNQLGGADGGDIHLHFDNRGAGPDETAKMTALGMSIKNSLRAETEYRLQRGGWPKGKNR